MKAHSLDEVLAAMGEARVPSGRPTCIYLIALLIGFVNDDVHALGTTSAINATPKDCIDGI